MKYQLRSVKNNEKKIHIGICLSHTYEHICMPFFDLLLSISTQYNYSIYRSNILPLERNRTHLADLALKYKDITHLLFIDTDIIPKDSNFLDIMISYDVPIIGLLCTKKIPPYEPILFKRNVPKEEILNGFWIKYPKGLVEVDATGTGCLLVKREVFEAIEKPYFKFYNSYTNNLFQSEDVYFLEKARTKNFKIYVDTEHTCLHYGLYGYSIDDFNNYMKNYHTRKDQFDGVNSYHKGKN